MEDSGVSRRGDVRSTAREPMSPWHTSRWPQMERQVCKLHKRLYRAAQRGDHRQVRRRQTLLRRSHSAKRLAVRQVPQDHRGKQTPGVEGIAALTPAARCSLAAHLQLDGNAAPGRRVYIPTPGTLERRPWGLPTVADRAKPGVVTEALEPAWEARVAPKSDGVRPGRRPWDALGALDGQINQQPTWVLEADSAQGFDRIDHEAL